MLGPKAYSIDSRLIENRFLHYTKKDSLSATGVPDGSVGKESTCNAGDTGEMGSDSGWKRSLEEEMATHSSILAWEIAWTQEPGRLQSRGSQSGTRLSD